MAKQSSSKLEEIRIKSPLQDHNEQHEANKGSEEEEGWWQKITKTIKIMEKVNTTRTRKSTRRAIATGASLRHYM